MLRPIALLAVAGGRGDRLRDDRRAAGRQPDLSARSPSTSSPRGAESDIKPRVFFRTSPTASSTCATSSRAAAGATCSSPTTRSRIRRRSIWREQRAAGDRPREAARCELVLENGTRHTTYPEPAGRLRRQLVRAPVLDMDRRDGLPADADHQGRQRDDDRRAARRLRPRTTRAAAPSYSQRYTIQQKFSLPAACLVLALIGVCARRQQPQGRQAGELRARLRRRLRLLHPALHVARRARSAAACQPSSRAVARQHRAGRRRASALVIWRAASADQPIRISIPRSGGARSDPRSHRADRRDASTRGARVVLVVRIPHIDWPRPRLLDLYVARQYLSVFGLAFVVAPRHLLHLDVHRPGRQAVPRRRDDADCCCATSISRRRSTCTTSSRCRRWSRRWSRSAC